MLQRVMGKSRPRNTGRLNYVVKISILAALWLSGKSVIHHKHARKLVGKFNKTTEDTATHTRTLTHISLRVLVCVSAFNDVRLSQM